MMKKYLVIAAIAGVVGFTAYNKVYIPKHTFQTTTLSKGDMSVKINGIGNVGAKEIYNIGSLYGGKVDSFNLNEGDFIKKGTLISQIDSIDLKDKIAELDATINKIKSDIKSSQINKQSAVVQYKYQKVIYNKNRQLFKRGSISELDFQKYKTNNDVAKLNVDSFNAKISSLNSQLNQIKSSKSGLEKRLSQYTIIAPIDGYITKKYISNFQIIMPNQNLLQIVNTKDVWVKTFIDTRISGEIKIGDSASIKLRSSNKVYEGKVVNIKPINNSVTNEREVDVSFNNLPIPFYLEEQASVSIDTKQLKDIIKIPLKYITIYKEKNGVWVQKGSTVNFKEIKALAYSDKFVATKDVSINDKLVLEDPNKKALKNGMKIYND